MSRETQKFFEQLQSGEPPTLIESIKEAASSLKDIGGAIWDGLKPAFDNGRTEAAAALFSGNAYVLYSKSDGVEQGQDQVDQVKEMSEDRNCLPCRRRFMTCRPARGRSAA